PNPFWLEMSAVWMEEQCYDKVNDYYYYLPEYIKYVHLSLRFFEANSLYPYGSAIFPIYLSETFGQGIVKTIWENCATLKGMNFLYGALQDAIDQHSNGTRAFEDVFAEYSRWLFFTGGRKPYFFEEAANYPKIPDTDTLGTEIIRPYIRYYSDFPDTVDRDYGFFPNALGINYVVLDVTTLDSGFTILDFKGVTSSPEPVGWRISVMGYNRFDPSVPVWVADSLYRTRDVIIVDDIGGLTDVVLVPVTTNPYYNKSSNSYFFEVVGGSRDVEGTVIRPPFPMPYRPAADGDLKVHVDLAESVMGHLDVFTVAGEKLYSQSRSGKQNGRIEFTWDGRSEFGEEVASGIYLLVVRVGDITETLKALVIR
ncbi:MAG: FlgD immunoglobulin-like domain containing protein, partial [bacterium]